MQAVSPLTIDDFEKLPDELAHNHELVDGALVDVSGNTIDHNYLRDLLTSLLSSHVKERKLGRVVSEQEYQFDRNAYGPDVSFFGPKKVKLVNRKLRVQRFVPDLAIEIVSENDTFKKLVTKVDRYRKCGTKEAWIFDIDSRRAFLFSDEREAVLNENHNFESTLVPGFAVRLKDLFDQI